MPRELSPQPMMSSRGSAQSKSHIKPCPGIAQGRFNWRICCMETSSGLRPPWQQNIFDATEIKANVKYYRNYANGEQTDRCNRHAVKHFGEIIISLAAVSSFALIEETRKPWESRNFKHQSKFRMQTRNPCSCRCSHGFLEAGRTFWDTSLWTPEAGTSSQSSSYHGQRSRRGISSLIDLDSLRVQTASTNLNTDRGCRLKRKRILFPMSTRIMLFYHRFSLELGSLTT